jgi:hypothetical protein
VYITREDEAVIRITLDGAFDATVSADLRDLEAKLVENGLLVSNTTITVPGVKVELVIALAIASLTMTSISTLVNVVNFWKSQRSISYRISLESKTGTVPLDNDAAKALAESIEQGGITSLKVEKI